MTDDDAKMVDGWLSSIELRYPPFPVKFTHRIVPGMRQGEYRVHMMVDMTIIEGDTGETVRASYATVDDLEVLVAMGKDAVVRCVATRVRMLFRYAFFECFYVDGVKLFDPSACAGLLSRSGW